MIPTLATFSFSLTSIYEKGTTPADKDAVVKHLREYLREFGGVSADKAIIANVKIGQILFEQSCPVKQVDGSMLAPSEIFNQAHDFTVFGAGDHHESRNLGLAECLICFQPALAANQFIAWSIGSVVFSDADGPLEAPAGRPLDRVGGVSRARRSRARASRPAAP